MDRILTLDANRASSVGSMALEATASALFLQKKIAISQNQSPPSQLQQILRFGHFFLARRGLENRKTQLSGLALHKVATERTASDRKVQSKLQNFWVPPPGFQRNNASLVSRAEVPQMTAFLPRQDSPPACPRVLLQGLLGLAAAL